MPTNTKQQLCIKPTGFLVVHLYYREADICLTYFYFCIIGGGIQPADIYASMSDFKT